MTHAALAQAYDTPGDRRGLDCHLTKDLQIDTARASATGVFAAAVKDRGGDVLEIAGIDTTNHQKNPIVLWLHGFDFKQSEANMPIGMTEDPDSKEYAVKLLPKEGIALATTFFTQKTLLGSQICALVMEKTVRAQSIGYREIEVDRMYEDDRYVGTHLKKVEMIETSWVPVPMNQDAVRSALSRDWCGKALHPSIKSALTPYAGQPPAWANGFTLGDKTMQPPPFKPGESQGPPVQPDPPATAKTKADNEGENQGDSVGDDEAVEKHGSKSLRSVHKALGACKRKCMKAMDGLDDDSDVKAEIQGAHDYVDEAHSGVKALHAKKYKDEDPLADEDVPGEEAKDDANDGGDDSEDEKALHERLRRAELALNHEIRLLNRTA